jgi:hypothetical protein
VWPPSPCVTSRTTIIPWFFSGAPPCGFHIYTCKFHVQYTIKQHPYFAGLDGMHFLKGQWPLNGVSCSSTVTLGPG